MARVRATYKMWFYINGAWVDKSSDVLGNVEAEWGISGNGPIDMVADTGTLSFDMNNMTGQYSPDGPSALTGWKKGIPVKHVFTYDGEDYVRFRGYIDDFDIDPGDFRGRRVHITCVDWMEYAATHPVVNPGILAEQTGDEVLDTVVPLVPIQPQATDYDTGINVFPTTFDAVTSKTKAYDEFVKVSFSEIGRVYLRRDKLQGETLVFESNQARHGWRPLTPVPKTAAESGFLLKEDGDKLLLETGDKLVLNDVTTGLTLDNDASVLDYDMDYGQGQINRFTVYAIPRRLDTSPQILFQLDAPIFVDTGQATTLKGYYVDPNGGLPINGKDMITPVITTDYLMNTKEDGTGANISTSLTVTTGYGTEGFTHSLTTSTPGWVTKFNCRGTGIYTYNPIEHAATDNPSIVEFGTKSESMTQKYKNDLYGGTVYVDSVVEEEGQPRTRIDRIYMTANKTSGMMMAFLNLDVGDLLRIVEDKSGKDAYFYIQQVKYRTMPPGAIFFDYVVKETQSLLLGMNQLAVEMTGTPNHEAIDFGPVPAVSNHTRRSFAAWVYSETQVHDYAMIVAFGGNVQFKISQQDGKMDFIVGKSDGSGDTAVWGTGSAVPFNAWAHVVLTHDFSGWPGSTTVKMYINGSEVTVTNPNVAENALLDETGLRFIIGNYYDSFYSTYGISWNGKLKDVRVYPRVITATEVTTLYNGGTPSASVLTDGLVFQAFVVRTKEYASYVDATLTDALKVRDNVGGAVGEAKNSPIGRAP